LFKKLGASLLLTGRNEKRLKDLVIELGKINTTEKSDVHYVIADLANESDIRKIFDELKQKFEKLDILINNAGILESGNIENTTLESFDRLMNINLRAVFLSTQLAVPFLEKTKGSIVNVSSVNGIRSVSFDYRVIKKIYLEAVFMETIARWVIFFVALYLLYINLL
jgi:short-subunit dehydrogenase